MVTAEGRGGGGFSVCGEEGEEMGGRQNGLDQCLFRTDGYGVRCSDF